MTQDNSEVLRLMLGKGWYELMEEYLNSNEFIKILYKNQVLRQEARKRKKGVYPSSNKVFRAFRETPYEDLSVVFIAQDPYHTPGAATGLATGVENSMPPPTLSIMYQEIERSCGKGELDTSLVQWAHQGVLLLNRALTVEQGKPGSHMKLWRPFTDKVISRISEDAEGIVFLLLGKQAKELIPLIDERKHEIVTGVHPAAECWNPKAGFTGSNVFKKVNDLVENNDRPRIQWLEPYKDTPF